MAKRWFIALLLTVPLLGWTQVKPPKEPTAGLAFGLIAHSFGFGFDVRYQVIRSTWSYDLGVSMTSYKHPQEAKVNSAYASTGGKDYVYDKLNYCYVLAPSVGLSRNLINRDIFNRVGIRGGFSAGPLLALLKPYYLQVAVPVSGSQAVLETDKYDPTKYNYSNIYGVADYFLGMNEFKMMPGARVKATTMVDLASSTAFIRGIELAFFADFYAKKLPLLGYSANKQVFLGGSVEILIGNTW